LKLEACVCRFSLTGSKGHCLEREGAKREKERREREREGERDREIEREKERRRRT
jgi:hypothetical protein